MGKVGKVIGTIFREGGQFYAHVFGQVFGDSVEHAINEFFGTAANLFDPLPPTYAYSPVRRGIEFSSSTEGTELPLIMGQRCRVPGVVVEIGKVIKLAVEDGGGKGGGADVPVNAVTYADVIYLCSENPINQISEIRGGNFTLWRKDATASVVSTGELLCIAGLGIYNHRTLTIYSPKGGPDLTIFEVGYDCTISGWNWAGNNQSGWRIFDVGFTQASGVSFLKVKDLSDTYLPATEDEAGQTITITEALPDIQKGVADAVMMTGGPAQTAIPEIVAFEEHTSAYRGRGGMFLKKLNIGKVGSLLNMTFYVDEREDPLLLSEAVDLIMTSRSSLSSSQWDATGLTGVVESYVVGPSSAADALRPLMEAFDFSWKETAAGILFFHRGTQATHTIDSDDLANIVQGEDDAAQFPASLSLRSALDRPSHCTAAFLDRNNDQQQVTVLHTRYAGIPQTHEVTVDLGNLSLERAEARKVAKRVLFAEDARKLLAEVRLPPKYFGIEHSDEINLTIEGVVHPLRVGRVEETNQWLNILQTHSHVDGVPYPGVTEPTTGTKDPSATELEIHAWRSGPLLYDHVVEPGFYLTACRSDPTTHWGGAVLFKQLPTGDFVPVDQIYEEAILGMFIAVDDPAMSIAVSSSTTFTRTTGSWIDDGFEAGLYAQATNFDIGGNNNIWLIVSRTDTVLTISGTLTTESATAIKSVGLLLSKYYFSGNPWNLSDFPKMHVWDRESEFVVDLLNKNTVLEARTKSEVLAGANRMVIGAEIIGYVNCEDLGGGRYKLSMLLRGLRDTGGSYLLPESKSPLKHTDREPCSVLNQPGVFFRAETLSEMNKTNVYKLVPVEGDIDQVEAFTMNLSTSVYESRGTLSPFSTAPPKSTAWGNGGNTDIILSMVRRTRAPVHVLRSQAIPLLEEKEQYEVVVKGSNGTYPDGGPDPDVSSAGRLLRSPTNDSVFGLLSGSHPNGPDIVNPLDPTGVYSILYKSQVWYSLADQITDGWTSDTMTVSIYQMSQSLGRGSIEALFVIKGRNSS